jgi:rubrerythrin
VTTSGSEQLTGISDTVFNLGSVFYHAAEGGQVYAKYIEDAEREGDTEVAEFFREVQEQDARRAQKAKALISKR